MTGDSVLVPLERVTRHCFYQVLMFDADVRGELTNVDERLVTRGEKTLGADLPVLEFSFPTVEQPPWPYVVLVPRISSRTALRVIESHLGDADRVMFHEGSMVMADGRTESAFIAFPTEYVDVLSSRSEIAPHGVALWWALELSKLTGRAFFQVPHASGTTVMRGDLILALAELGWPGYCYELRVKDGDRTVWYDEWADHPEWTDYTPPV
jgi:hypothetical protein